MGIGILYAAFPGVSIVLSANLSEERFFNGVFEQRLIFNQPVEVRVGPRVSGSSKVISPGGYVLLSLPSPKGS